MIGIKYLNGGREERVNCVKNISQNSGNISKTYYKEKKTLLRKLCEKKETLTDITLNKVKNYV